MKDVLILGVGNLVLNDEGVGIHIIQMLKSAILPEGVDLIDAGVGGDIIYDTLQGYKQVILIDSAVDEAPIGTVRRLSAEHPDNLSLCFLAHEQGVRNIIVNMQAQEKVPHIEMLAISVSHSPVWGIQLSPEVRNVIPQVVQLVLEILDNVSHPRFYR